MLQNSMQRSKSSFIQLPPTNPQLWDLWSPECRATSRNSGISAQWFGHVTRMPYERLAWIALLDTPTRKRPRQPTNDQVAWLHLWPCWARLDVDPLELLEVAGNREEFRIQILLFQRLPRQKTLVW